MKNILTLGGCTLVEACKALGDQATSLHFWRASMTTLATAPVPSEAAHFENGGLSRFVDREATKTRYEDLKHSKADLICFECAGEFAYGHLRIGSSTIVADARSQLFKHEFGEFDFPADGPMASGTPLDPDSDEYWELWQECLRKVYREAFLPKLRNGQAVAYLSRRFCLEMVVDGQTQPVQDKDLYIARNKRMALVDDAVRQLAGIEIIEIDESLLVTAPGAPWGGPWPFHPTMPYYDALSAKIRGLLSLTAAQAA